MIPIENQLFNILPNCEDAVILESVTSPWRCICHSGAVHDYVIYIHFFSPIHIHTYTYPISNG